MRILPKTGKFSNVYSVFKSLEKITSSFEEIVDLSMEEVFIQFSVPDILGGSGECVPAPPKMMRKWWGIPANNVRNEEEHLEHGVHVARIAQVVYAAALGTVQGLQLGRRLLHAYSPIHIYCCAAMRVSHKWHPL